VAAAYDVHVDRERAVAPDAMQRASHQLLEAFLHLSPDAAVVVDRAGTIRGVNDLAAVMFGWLPTDLDGQPVETLIPDRQRAGHRQQLLGYAAAPHPRPMGHPGLELRGLRHDGSEFPVDISLAPLSAAGDTETFIVAAIRDVTELRHRERLAARLAAIVHASDAAILSTLPDRTIDSWNPAAERILGHSAADVLGHPLDDLVPDDERAHLDATYRSLAAGAPATLSDTWRLRSDGTRVPVAVTTSAMREPHDQLIGYCEVLRDMTERHQHQQELAAALAAREKFADRDRIARHLHNTVIHRIFAAGIAVRSAESLVDDPAVRQRLEHAVTELDTAVKEIRTSIFTISAAVDR
jgi:PAS domain S-box-containing protein